ncbi:MAG: hypothetical protein IT438_07320 [Phycisphaerales bacterium]|nr:hypothetical protein [Phycisphaerales bacterium]
MALVYCGIDEAGYGPLLGPLCVGASIFKVDDWCEGDEAPDLWRVLKQGVCRASNDRQRRIAIDDSKKLKLANGSTTRHPLHHLERGVLACLAVCEEQEEEAAPVSDIAFLRSMSVSDACEAWYQGPPRAMPLSFTPGEIAIAANTLRVALLWAGVRLLGMRAEAVTEAAFNQIAEAAQTKAAVTESVIARYLSEVWERFACAEDERSGVRVVCDRQGGRVQYAQSLSRMFPEAVVTVVGETTSQSVYDIAGVGGVRSDGRARRMRVSFRVEAEAAHLPVALASMLAKLTRELMMARFNLYWCGRIPELKPTAGYALDARRWLNDVREFITADERRSLVRRA